MTNECLTSMLQDPLPANVLPESLAEGATILLACTGDPAQYAVDLHILSQYGHRDEMAFIVTTTGSAEQTIKKYTALKELSDQMSMGIVDTVSNHQSISALYDQTPIIFTPSPDDLERIVIALSDLSDSESPVDSARHLSIQSLSPILKTTPTDRVCSFLKQISGFRSETGLCLLGLDYTVHNQDTVAAIVEHVDCVLWVSQSSSGDIDLEYSPSRDRHV